MQSYSIAFWDLQFTYIYINIKTIKETIGGLSLETFSLTHTYKYIPTCVSLYMFKCENNQLRRPWLVRIERNTKEQAASALFFFDFPSFSVFISHNYLS